MWQTIGQDRAIALFRRGLASGQLSHAYLFSGPAHVGKMTLALDLARALNCTAAERPCGQCLSCHKIAAGLHPDVQVIGLARSEDGKKLLTEISIEQVGEMLHSASLPPFEGRTKVFIVAGAELLSTEAANRMLKTLEEPVGGPVFLLLTSDERLVPATVVSRCQRIELRPVAVPALEAALRERQIAPETAALVARLSHGCPGWAINAAADQALLQSRADLLDRLTTTIQSGYDERFAYAGQLAAQFGQERARVLEVLDLWLDYWRDLLLAKAGCPDLISGIDRAEVAGLAATCSLEEVQTFIKSVRACVDGLRKNVSPKLALENLMLEMPIKGGVLPGRTA